MNLKDQLKDINIHFENIAILLAHLPTSQKKLKEFKRKFPDQSNVEIACAQGIHFLSNMMNEMKKMEENEPELKVTIEKGLENE